MKPVFDMLLVVHVPKTAGTSFRQALDIYFGPDNVVRDYGYNQEATTAVVWDHLYVPDEARPISELVKSISESSKKVIIGHFPVVKYADYFAPQNIIGFMRDPLIRTCSEFMHRMRNASYDGTFCDFMHEDSIRNIQMRFLNGMPEESIIGLTEKYRESLAYINHTFQLKIGALNRNIDSKGGGQKFAESLSRHELTLFEKLNEEDLELYARATQRFDALNIPQTRGQRFISWLNGR